jgi:hypothetical protein
MSALNNRSKEDSLGNMVIAALAGILVGGIALACLVALAFAVYKSVTI